MNLQDLLRKASRSLDFNDTLEDLNNEELEYMYSLLGYELNERTRSAQQSKMSSVLGHSDKFEPSYQAYWIEDEV